MSKIRILFLISGLTGGGAEYMLKKVIKFLIKRNFRIVICSLTKNIDILDEIRPFAHKLYILNIGNLKSCIKGYTLLRKIIDKERPDILHCIMPYANLFGRFAGIGFKVKVISSLRVKLMEKKYLNFFDRITQIFVDKYTVNSKVLKNFTISQGIKKKKIALIENGIDFEDFKVKKDLNNLRVGLNLPNLPIITTIAHIRKQKDYPSLIKALYRLKNDVNFYFLSVGYETEFERESQKIKELIDKYQLKNIKFLGFRRDIPEILALTDIWVSTTLYEGQSNSLLEAMAMKKPIITTDIPENAEVVRNGIEAILISVKSPTDMADAIKKLMNNKGYANILAQNAFKRVNDKYNIKITVKKLENLYNSLLN